MTTEVYLPRLGSTTGEEAKVVEWLVAAGGEVVAGQPLVEVETDKTSFSVEAPADGTLLRIDAAEGVSVAVGGTLGWLGADGDELPEARSVEAASAVESDPAESAPSPDPPGEPSPVGVETSNKVRAAPAARRRAQELGVDLAGIIGTGPAGRVTLADVDGHRVPSAIVDRTAVAARLSDTWREVPSVTLQRLVEIGRDAPLDFGTRLLRAVALALAAHPAVNAWWVDGRVETRKVVDIGVAVQAGPSLLVPVLRHVDRLGDVELARERRDLVQRALDGELRSSDLGGASFTVSNLGPFGVDAFNPIVNRPEVAILGVGRLRDVVVPVRGGVEARWCVTLSLTFDHRALDGAPAAEFLSSVADTLVQT